MQVVVTTTEQALERAKEAIYEQVDNKTVLFLSGGKTPQKLYEALAKEKIVKPAAVALIDERYGKPLHEESNERMIADTGLLSYFRAKKIPVHLILQEGKTPQELAAAYDEVVRNLFFHFHKSVGILGIGTDGHTAGIAPNRKDFTNPIFDNSQKHLFVSSFDDPKGSFKTRVTLTFAGLALLDSFIVLVLGKAKAKALQQTFTQGPLSEIPARVYGSKDIAKKVLFVTDQRV